MLRSTREKAAPQPERDGDDGGAVAPAVDDAGNQDQVLGA